MFPCQMEASVNLFPHYWQPANADMFCFTKTEINMLLQATLLESLWNHNQNNKQRNISSHLAIGVTVKLLRHFTFLFGNVL